MNASFYVQVKYRTIDQSAFDGKDFVGTKDGILSFKSGETAKDILIPIIDDMSATGTDEYFEVQEKQCFLLLCFAMCCSLSFVSRLSFLSFKELVQKVVSLAPSREQLSRSLMMTSIRISSTT